MTEEAVQVPRHPARIVPTPRPGLNSLLTLVTFVVVVAALYLARKVLVPITRSGPAAALG